MNGKKIKKTVCALLCLLTCGASITGIALTLQSETAEADDAQIAANLEDMYSYGTTFTMPAKIKISDVEYEAKATLVSPSGKAYDTPTVELWEYGTYKLVCFATVNGKSVRVEDSFDVYQSFAKVSSISSEMNYSEKLLCASTEKESVKGVYASLSQGDSLTFNKPVNLNENGGGMYEIINIFPYSLNQKADMLKSCEAEEIIVTLTDAYDANNQVSLLINYKAHSEYGKYRYYRAGVGNGSSIGVQEYADSITQSSTRKEVYIDGIRHVARINDSGTQSSNHTDYPDAGISVLYDCTQNRMYVNDTDGATKNKLISDLDDAELYGEDAFRGFTTGEVYVSISAASYLENKVQVEIDRFDSLTGEDLLQSYYADNVAPVVVVDVPEKASLQVAKGEKIKVFDAQAIDVNLEGGVQSSVYYNYGTDYGYLVPQSDGYFTPTKTGVYTIVYSAKDTFGNKAIKTVELNCREATFGKTIDFSTTQLTELSAGVECVLPEYTVNGLNGGIEVRIFARYGEEEVIEISVDNRTWTPLSVGEYEIVYEYGDGVANYVYAYKVNAAASQEIAFLDTISLPSYFIKDMTYSIEPFYAYTFTGSEPTANRSNVFVKADDETEYTAIDPDAYEVKASERVFFKFEYQGASYETEAIPVIDVGFNSDEGIDMTRYFVGDFSKQATGEYISFTSNTAEGENSFAFINPLSLKNFELIFKIPVQQANFTHFDLLVSDYYDRENTVTLTYQKFGDSYALIQDNGNPKYVKSTLLLADTSFTITYNDGFMDLVSSRQFGGKMQTVSDKILLAFRFRGMDGECGVQISKINNQAINNKEDERVAPLVTVGEMAGTRKLNDIVTIYAPTVIDVLTSVPNANIRCSVKTPSGKSATAYGDGVLLDGNQNSPTKAYQMQLTEYGTYRVYYIVSDQYGNSYTHTFTIIAGDDNAPTITTDVGELSGNSIKATAGTYVQISDFTVSDDISATENIVTFCTVITPRNVLQVLDTNEFALTMKGKWQIIIYAYDEAQNYAMYTYYVIAE